MGEEGIRGFYGIENPWLKETQQRASEVEDFSSPKDNERDDFTVGCKRERVKNPGVLKIHLHFLDGNCPPVLFFIWKKMNCKDCVLKVFLNLKQLKLLKFQLSLY